MSGRNSGPPRKPASKFAHLRKSQQAHRTSSQAARAKTDKRNQDRMNKKP